MKFTRFAISSIVIYICLDLVAIIPAQAETSLERYSKHMEAATRQAADGQYAQAEDEMSAAVTAALRVHQLGDEDRGFVSGLIEAYSKLGVIQEKAHHEKAAVRSFNKALEASYYPDSVDIAADKRKDIRDHLIKLYLASHQLDELVSIFSAWADETYFQWNQKKTYAPQVLERVSQESKASANPGLLKAYCKKRLDLSQKQFPEPDIYWKKLAALAMEEHRYEDVVDNLRKIVRRGRYGGICGNLFDGPTGKPLLPENEGFWQELSQCCRRAGNLKEANRIDAIAKARLEFVKRGEDGLSKSRKLSDEARKYRDANDWSAAQSKAAELLSLHRALEYAPGDEYQQALSLVAQIQQEAGDFEAAKKLYEEIISNCENYDPPWNYQRYDHWYDEAFLALVALCKEQKQTEQAQKYQKTYDDYLARSAAAKTSASVQSDSSSASVQSGSSSASGPQARSIEILPAVTILLPGAQKTFTYRSKNAIVNEAHWYIGAENGDEIVSPSAGNLLTYPLPPREYNPGVYTGDCVYYAPALALKNPVYLYVIVFDKQLCCGRQRGTDRSSCYEGKDKANRQIASGRTMINVGDLAYDCEPGQEITLQPGGKVSFKFTIHNVSDSLRFHCIQSPQSRPSCVIVDQDDPVRKDGTLTVAGVFSARPGVSFGDDVVTLQLRNGQKILDKEIHIQVRPSPNYQ